MKEIYFVRHGQTDWNAGTHTDSTNGDIHINSIGRAQAKTTGMYLKDYRLKDLQFDAIYSSPLNRALDTAKIISDQLGLKNDIIVISALREHEYNKPSISGNIDERYREALEILEDIHDPIEKEYYMHNTVDPIKYELGYESIDSRMHRVRESLDTITKSDYHKIVVVSHSGTISDILQYITHSRHPCYGDLTNGSNCTITYIEYENGTYTVGTSPNTLHLGMYDMHLAKERDSSTISDIPSHKINIAVGRKRIIVQSNQC